MEKNKIQVRLQELKNLEQEADLNRLSRRLLDFISDVEVPPYIRQKAISLRASYNAAFHVSSDMLDKEELGGFLIKAKTLVSELEKHISMFHDDLVGTPKIVGDLDEQTVALCSGLSKEYKNSNYTFELGPLDLQLRLGEITGVVGENGNGKTTLLRIIAGDLDRSKGYIHYPLFESLPEDWYKIKQQIAFIPQQLPEWKGFLKENLHFNASIHGLLAEENEKQVEYVIHRLGLTKYEDALWSEISSGYKLRFEMARALVWSPRILIIDEPLANLDINAQKIFLQDLRYLADSIQNPMAILLSSQHLHEVESIADNIMFLKDGKVQYNGAMLDFGKDRKENLFELSCQADKETITKSLSSFQNLKVEDHAQYFIIRAARTIEGNAILSNLVDTGIQVEYFRNISTSTLRLFRTES